MQAFRLGLALDRVGAGHHQHAHVLGHPAPAQHAGDGAQVFHAPVGARAHEHHVHLAPDQRRVTLEAHVGKAARGNVVALGGHVPIYGNDLARIGAPGDGGAHVGGVDHDLAVVARIRVADELLPAFHGGVEVGTLRRLRTAAQVGEGGFVGSDQAGARARLDAHVAHGHAPFHGQCADRLTAVFDDVAGAAVHAQHADDVQDQVLGGGLGRQRSMDGDRERFRAALQKALGGQHVAHFGGADAERQRAERAVGGGMGIPAHDGHARLGRAQLRSHHVDDAALVGIEAVQRNAELAAVVAHGVDLLARGRVLVRQGTVGVGRQRGRGVVERGKGALRAAHGKSARAQLVEGLRRGDFVHQMQVDVQHGRRVRGLGANAVRVPNLVDDGFHGAGMGNGESMSRIAVAFSSLSPDPNRGRGLG